MTGFRQLGTKLRNWRRWGPDDELGTVNFITPTSRKRGAQAVRSGTVVDLGMPFDAHGPQSGGLRFNPIHRMTRLLSDGDFTGPRPRGAVLYGDSSGVLCGAVTVNWPRAIAACRQALAAHSPYEEALNAVTGTRR